MQTPERSKSLAACDRMESYSTDTPPRLAGALQESVRAFAPRRRLRTSEGALQTWPFESSQSNALPVGHRKLGCGKPSPSLSGQPARTSNGTGPTEPKVIQPMFSPQARPRNDPVAGSIVTPLPGGAKLTQPMFSPQANPESAPAPSLRTP